MHLSTTEYSVCIPKITAKSQDIISSGTRGASVDPQLDPRNRNRTTDSHLNCPTIGAKREKSTAYAQPPVGLQ